MSDEKKKIADESPKTKKAREKLKKKLDAADQRMTQQALEKKTIEIHRWIARHARHRVVLRSKNISLFDENQNAAALSSRVASLAEQLRSDTQPTPDLSARVFTLESQQNPSN
jgi:hypothetical protein